MLDELQTGGEERRRTSLTEHVFSAFCRALLRGEYVVGQPLPSEADLSARFNVSKAVIRAVLQQLSALGVIEIRQGKPSIVKRLSPRPLEYFFSFALMETESGLIEAVQLRRGLETYIAQRAAEHIKVADIRKLREVIRTMEKARSDPEAFIEADLAFHMTLAQSSDNRLLMFLIQALKGTIHETVRMLHEKGMSPDRSTTIARHVAIVDAIESGDPEKARQAMSAHFDASEDKTLEANAHGKIMLEPERVIDFLELRDT